MLYGADRGPHDMGINVIGERAMEAEASAFGDYSLRFRLILGALVLCNILLLRTILFAVK